MPLVSLIRSSRMASATQVGLELFNGALVMGAGRELPSGTFSSALIDDVRIYNRAPKLVSLRCR